MWVGTENVSIGLLKEIIKLDKIGYLEDTAPLEWYKERYSEIETIVVARKKGVLKGYCCITGIDKDIYEVILKGLLTGDYSISPKAFKPLAEGDTFYMTNVVVHPEERLQNIAVKMMYKAIREITKYTEEYSVVTISITKGGKIIADKTGFKEIVQVGDRYVLEKTL